MVADARWKYHHYVGYEPELFDLENDPEEAVNLAGDLAHAGTVAFYEAKLRDLLNPEDADRQAKADQAALIESHGGREAALTKGTKGATPVPI